VGSIVPQTTVRRDTIVNYNFKESFFQTIKRVKKGLIQHQTYSTGTFLIVFSWRPVFPAVDAMVARVLAGVAGCLGSFVLLSDTQNDGGDVVLGTSFRYPCLCTCVCVNRCIRMYMHAYIHVCTYSCIFTKYFLFSGSIQLENRYMSMHVRIHAHKLHESTHEYMPIVSHSLLAFTDLRVTDVYGNVQHI